MAVSRLSDFASTSTTANNAERFGPWTLIGGGDRITLLAECLSGDATDANVRAYVGGRRMRLIASATQQTNRGVIAFELLQHELPASGAQQVIVYWPSATRIHITAVEWSGTRQRPTPSGDVFFATSASAQNANLTGTAPTNGGALHMMAWFGGTSSWTLGSGQTKIGVDNQQTTFLSVGGYETGLSAGSQASDCSVGAAAAPIGQICMFLAEDAQDLVALDPADGATSVSTSPTLEVELSATVVQGTGSLRVYETVTPSASPTVDDAATSANSTNASPFTVSIPTTSAGQRLLVIVATDGARYSAAFASDVGSPSPWHGVYRGAGFLICYRECDGTEPSTYDFTTAPAEGCVARAYLISGHDPNTPPAVAFTIGDSGTVDPPSVTFPWGTEPTLVFAFAGMDNGSTVSGSSYPSGYTGTGTQASTQATTNDRAGLGWCYKSGVTAGSENPGTFTLTAGEGWNGITVAIRPADPSVLVDTIDVASATLAGATAQFAASGLAASTAHHVVLDAGAIEDYEGIWLPTAWNFTTGASGATELSVGRADETDAAFSFTLTKQETSGLASETDEAQAPTGAKTAAPGQALETDAAQGLAGTKTGAVGLAAETDAAEAIAGAKQAAPGLAAETDTAQAREGRKTAAPGLAEETDEARHPGVAVAIGLAEETDEAEARSGAKTAAPGRADETDAAFSLFDPTTYRDVGRAEETDAAFAPPAAKARAPGLASEADAAQAPGGTKTAAVGQALETNTAQALSGAQGAAIGLAEETDEAAGLAGVKTAAPGLAEETDTALDPTEVADLDQIPAIASAMHTPGVTITVGHTARSIAATWSPDQ